MSNSNPFIVNTIKKWLYSRGGRTQEDLKKDSNGYFIMMSTGIYNHHTSTYGQKKVYLPDELKNDV